MTSHGRHDELKEWLTRRWESSDSEPPPATPTGVKRKASDVLETPADSTDDVFTTGSRAVARKGSSGKVSKSNILLASLLATRASVEQPVVNTLSIGSMATVTPQSSLLRRASADQLHSVVGDLAASGAVRKSSSSAVSSATSLSAAGDTAVTSASLLPRPPLHRSYSQAGSRRANPTLAEANLPYQDSGVDVSSEDLVSADVVESLFAGTATSSALSLAAGVDDRTLLSQFEQFLSSQGTELESLLGDGFADLTSSLFGTDQSDVGSQAAMTSAESQVIKVEPHCEQLSASRGRGSGLLGQLLDAGSADCGAEMSSAATVTSEALPQRPNSLAVSSAYFHRGTNYSHLVFYR